MSLVATIAMLDAWLAWQSIEPPAPAGSFEILSTPVHFVETKAAETVLRRRPWVPNRRVATLSAKTRLVVHGKVESRDKRGCKGQPWYAVSPYGFVCSRDVRSIKAAPPLGSALPLRRDRRLPHRYAFVREDGVPMYTHADAIAAGEVERELVKRMSIVVADTVTVGGERYVQTPEGWLISADEVWLAGQGSAFRGVGLRGSGRTGLSFGWARGSKRQVFNQPSTKARHLGNLDYRARVPIFEERGEGKKRWLRIGPDRWVRSNEISEVRIVEPPPSVKARKQRWTRWVSGDRAPTDVPTAAPEAGTPELGTKDPLLARGSNANSADETAAPNDAPTSPVSLQWFDVDVGEQVLVAYRDETPVYATMVSSGRSHPTPLGDYPVWAKVASMTMASQAYEDDPYMVQGVPWVLLFQGHNAFHGAYWHDGFGRRKSHGCVNLSPVDARWVFEWSGPRLQRGWTGYLPDALDESPLVHVRDSSLPAGKRFVQERPHGPPDREEERLKLEEAEERRAKAALEAEAEAAKLAALEGGDGVEIAPNSSGSTLVPGNPIPKLLGRPAGGSGNAFGGTATTPGERPRN